MNEDNYKLPQQHHPLTEQDMPQNLFLEVRVAGVLTDARALIEVTVVATVTVVALGETAVVVTGDTVKASGMTELPQRLLMDPMV